MGRWTVRDVMTPDVVAVREDATYRQVVDTLAQRAVSAVPVIDATGRVVGVVSEADVLHKVEFSDGKEERRGFPRPSRRAARVKAHAAAARDLMTAPAVTIGPDESVAAAAKLIESRRVKRLPVVDGEGNLLGIVSRRDLMKTHLRPDGDIRADIAEHVLRRSLWLDPTAVSVDVRDGVAELGGQVDRRTTATFAVRLAEGVPGVVAVVDHICWDHDDTVSPIQLDEP